MDFRKITACGENCGGCVKMKNGLCPGVRTVPHPCLLPGARRTVLRALRGFSLR